VPDSARIPEALRRFLAGRIDSLEALEALLLLRRNPDRVWDEDGVAEALHVPRSLAADALEALARAGLCEYSTTGTIAARYRPSTKEMSDHIDELLRHYDSNRIGLVNAMNENAIERIRRGMLRAFADAFLFKHDRGKDDDDG
jgi:hypothetical protein